ncbi:hypothetical protein LWF15_21600 [Kineosporia rhizophila]|uniref:calcium-binding protein n=1 Tax=Kineosporia TaxID=49184 RepID=UPI000ADA48CB|nr:MULTISPECIES: calcium-binding protein [Kineosporia]MCE0538094.1 hypothetical protein [Kineosporia rhizophila]GLY14922.1 hypothetical protein Kisp01_19370 [Kineosporia sp. NBRC 101677]
MTLRRNRLFILAGSTSLAAAGLFATPAHAAGDTATAELSGRDGRLNLFTYEGGDLRNQAEVVLSLSEDRSVYTYEVDDVVDIKAGTNCAHPDSADLTKVVCEIENVVGGTTSDWPSGQISFGAGNDTVEFTNRTTTYFNAISLDAGNDTYTGSPLRDAVVSGNEGTDTLNIGGGGEGHGDEGNDLITLVAGRAMASGGDGEDEIQGGVGGDSLHGGADDDVIYGNDGDDLIYGDQGNDFLYGGREHDEIYGNSGDDTIFGNSGNDTISGGPGTDTISGGTGSNTITN